LSGNLHWRARELIELGECQKNPRHYIRIIQTIACHVILKKAAAEPPERTLRCPVLGSDCTGITHGRGALLAHTRKGVTAVYARWDKFNLQREMAMVVERSLRGTLNETQDDKPEAALLAA